MRPTSCRNTRTTRSGHTLLVLALAGFLASAPALAAKPDSPGSDKARGAPGHVTTPGARHGPPADVPSAAGARAGNAKGGFRFDDRQRSTIRDYFGKEFSRGRCPPGLAKKRNGCMPPGLAKKWSVGRPLPRDVIFHDLPYGLLRELGRAPSGHKYVRVAADVLLIAVGTGMVVDAIEDLTGL